MVYLTMEDSMKCGCNYTATKRISKTASITSISETKRATRFNVCSNIQLIALVILMTHFLAICQVDAMALRPRQLRKRHSLTAVDWENPCGGVYEGSYSPDSSRKKTSFKQLRTTVRNTYRTLKATKDPRINTKDIQMWFAHNKTYKFLPKLRLNSSIALKRWYSNAQTFVGGFSYLHTTQRNFDEVKLNNQEGKISKELQTLLDDARTILCEIETTINHTIPNSHVKKLRSVSRDAMNERLKFRTKKHLSENLYEVDEIDLKFMKFYFMKFLQNMSVIIKQRNPNVYNGSGSNSLGNTSVISLSSQSVSSNERNTFRRLPARKQNRNRHRQRPNKNTSLSTA